MFFNYRPGFKNSDFLGQLRAERSVANELGLDLRAKFLKNVETLLQSFHESGTCTRDVLKPTNGDVIEVVKMKMKNEAQRVLKALGGRGEEDESESHNEESEELIQDRCHVRSHLPKAPLPKKTYRYRCPVSNINTDYFQYNKDSY